MSRVLSGCNANPFAASRSPSSRKKRSASPRYWNPSTKSSAYRTTIMSPLACCGRQVRATHSSSTSWRTTFASGGEITEPWGVPSPVSVSRPASITPALNHLRINRSTRRSPIRLSRSCPSLSLSMQSKNLLISASSTQLILRFVIPYASAPRLGSTHQQQPTRYSGPHWPTCGSSRFTRSMMETDGSPVRSPTCCSRAPSRARSDAGWTLRLGCDGFLTVSVEPSTVHKTHLRQCSRKRASGNPFAPYRLNERQRMMLSRLLDRFEGKLTVSKWAKITKRSPDTALRDIIDLMGHGILVRSNAGGRSTSYQLPSRIA